MRWILYIGMFFLCMPLQAQEVQWLAADPFYIQLNQSVGAVLLDVREEAEYRRERIPQALNAPESDILYAITDTLDREQALFIYCDLEDRSETVASLLQEREFQYIYVLKGGMSAWKKSGLPLDEKRLPKRKRQP